MSGMREAERSRSLTEAEREAWAEAARHVTPLPDRALPSPAPAQESPAEKRPGRPQPPARAAETLPALIVGVAPAGLDSRSWKRLLSGGIAPARVLDLHGRVLSAAFHDFGAFMRRAAADRLRCVEIITGQGAGGRGALRAELPLWLNLAQFRPLVLAAVYPHPANPGAVRLLLRRVR